MEIDNGSGKEMLDFLEEYVRTHTNFSNMKAVDLESLVREYVMHLGKDASMKGKMKKVGDVIFEMASIIEKIQGNIFFLNTIQYLEELERLLETYGKRDVIAMFFSALCFSHRQMA